MNKPEVVIVVEGGVVTNVATSLKELTYGIIDIDAIKSGEQGFAMDYGADPVGTDVEKYSEEIIEDARNH